MRRSRLCCTQASRDATARATRRICAHEQCFCANVPLKSRVIAVDTLQILAFTTSALTMDGSTLAHPQDFHPDLTSERMAVLGKLVFDAHNSAVLAEDVREGDGPWSTGCRAYERVLNKVKKLSGTMEWLTMKKEGSLAFFILVGTCPMRIRKPDQQRCSTFAEQSASKEMQRLLFEDHSMMGATLRLQKVLEPRQPPLPDVASTGDGEAVRSRRVIEILLSVVSGDDSVSYQTWTIYTPPSADVHPTTRDVSPFTPQRPPLGPRGVVRDSNDIEDV